MLWAAPFPRQGARQAGVCSFLLWAGCSDGTTSLSPSLDFPPIMNYNPELYTKETLIFVTLSPMDMCSSLDFSFLSGRADLGLQFSQNPMVVGRTWARRVSVEQVGAELSTVGKRRPRCLSFR